MIRRPFRPLQLLDLDADQLPGPVTAALDPDGRPYTRAQLLVCRDGRPRGISRVDFVNGQLSEPVLEVIVTAVAPDIDLLPPLPVPTTGPPATVLIASRGRPASLLRCLRSVRHLDYRPFDVVVVDNGERTDLAWEVVDEVASPDFEVTYVHEPISGLSTAHNAGLRAATADFVAITDDDVEVDPSWLGALVEQFVAHPDAAAVTGLIYPAALDYPAQARAESTNLGKGFELRRFDLASHRPDDPRFPVAVGMCGSGANMAFRRKVLEQIGGFDLALGAGSPSAGGDDLAALHDVLRLGYAVIYQPAAVVRHHHDPDPAALEHQALTYGRGLGAYLTRCAVRDPAGFAAIVGRSLAGRRRWTRHGSGQSAIDGLVRGHRLRQLRGLALGPLGYVAGQRRAAVIAPRVGARVSADRTAIGVTRPAPGLVDDRGSRLASG
jgi:O-antigen biosynthesis protein